jgi:hypothetical protein
MSKRIAAILLAASAVAACSNGGGASTTTPATFPAAATPAATTASTTGAPTGTGGVGTDVDPNTVAGFCQLMTQVVAANWPPKDAAAATLISPFLRNWSIVPAFAAVGPALLAVADWTASMSIMSTVPAPPRDVAAAWDQIKTFQTTSCA